MPFARPTVDLPTCPLEKEQMANAYMLLEMNSVKEEAM
jgi:hypothetical protein